MSCAILCYGEKKQEKVRGNLSKNAFWEKIFFKNILKHLHKTEKGRERSWEFGGGKFLIKLIQEIFIYLFAQFQKMTSGTETLNRAMCCLLRLAGKGRQGSNTRASNSQRSEVLELAGGPLLPLRPRN